MMESQRTASPPGERPHYEHTVATLVDAMGSAEFERVRAAGRALGSRREAVDYALAAGSTA